LSNTFGNSEKGKNGHPFFLVKHEKNIHSI